VRGGVAGLSCLLVLWMSGFRGPGPRSHTRFWPLMHGVGPATGDIAGWGGCLTTHPQLRVWVVKHLKEGCWWWLAR
jgi:hypothetical protein